MRPNASAKHSLFDPSLARYFAAAICLLAMLLPAVSCLHAIAHPHAACSHCAHPQPLNQNTPPCCSVTHHHPQAIVAPLQTHQPAQLASPLFVLAHLDPGHLAHIYVPAHETPPSPPPLTLRI